MDCYYSGADTKRRTDTFWVYRVYTICIVNKGIVSSIKKVLNNNSNWAILLKDRSYYVARGQKSGITETVYAISQSVDFYHCDFLIYRCFVHAWRMLFNKMNRCKVYICGKKSKTSRGDFSIIFLAKKNSPCNINLKKKLVLRKEFNYKDIVYHSITWGQNSSISYKKTLYVQKYDLLHSLSIIRNVHWDSSCNQFERSI